MHAVLPQSASDRRGGIQARDGRQRLGAHMLYDSCRCGDKPDQILFSLVLLCGFHSESALVVDVAVVATPSSVLVVLFSVVVGAAVAVDSASDVVFASAVVVVVVVVVLSVVVVVALRGFAEEDTALT